MANPKLKQLITAIKLSRLPGVGAAEFKRLLDLHLTPQVAYKEFYESEVSLSAQSKNKSSVEDLIDATIKLIKAGSMHGTFYSSPEYPKQIAELSEPPPVLFSKSRIKKARYAAVVGARMATHKGCEMTKFIVRKLAEEGFVVVSGGAIGVDSCAHEEALKLSVETVAVLANGVDVCYPPKNKSLFDEIALKGNLISEFFANTKPRRSFFPTRNRIIAALADIVVIVQASAKSGSMITAKWASKLNRKIVTIKPQAKDDSRWDGNRLLIDAGAGVFELGNNSVSSVGNCVSEDSNIFYDAIPKC